MYQTMSDISSGDLHRHTIVSERKSQDGCRAALLMPKSTRTDKEVHTFQKSQGRKSRCTTVLPRYDHDDADAEDNKKHQNTPPSEKANIATPRRKPAATRELWKGPTTHRLAVQGGRTVWGVEVLLLPEAGSPEYPSGIGSFPEEGRRRRRQIPTKEDGSNCSSRSPTPSPSSSFVVSG